MGLCGFNRARRTASKNAETKPVETEKREEPTIPPKKKGGKVNEDSTAKKNRVQGK